MAKGKKLLYVNTDYWFACPCGFRYDKCDTKTQLQLISKLHLKTCDIGSKSKLSIGDIRGTHILSEKSQAQHVDEAILKANSS